MERYSSRNTLFHFEVRLFPHFEVFSHYYSFVGDGQTDRRTSFVAVAYAAAFSYKVVIQMSGFEMSSGTT